MKLFFNKLAASRRADDATLNVLQGLAQLRRQGAFSGESLDALVREASHTISASWPESHHKRAILGCLAKLAD